MAAARAREVSERKAHEAAAARRRGREAEWKEAEEEILQHKARRGQPALGHEKSDPKWLRLLRERAIRKDRLRDAEEKEERGRGRLQEASEERRTEEGRLEGLLEELEDLGCPRTKDVKEVGKERVRNPTISKEE